MTGPREAAAVLGTVTVVACTLWYVRVAGFWWGLAGGLLVATSFWQLMFGRQAVEYISMAAVSSLGLLALWIAFDPVQPGKRSSGDDQHRDSNQEDSNRNRAASRSSRHLVWFIVAGLIFGTGFYTHPAFRFVLPAVILCSGFLIWRSPPSNRTVLLAGPILGLIAMLIVMTPLGWYYIENPDDYRRGFEAAGGLSTARWHVVWDYLVALQGFAWEGPDSQQTNLSGRALLNPILAIWCVAGLLLAIRHPLRPLNGVALIWLVFAILPAAMLTTSEAGLLLAATPVVFLFPVISFSTAFKWISARYNPENDKETRSGSSYRESSRPASYSLPIFAAVFVLSIVVSSSWSLNDYFRIWMPDEETAIAMRGDVRDAVEATHELPNDGWPIYISAGEAERIVRYLAPDRAHHIYNNQEMLPMTSNGNSYLVYAETTAPDAELVALLPQENLVDSGQLTGDGASYRIWFLNALTRQDLPYIVPAVPYENGYRLRGFDIQTASTATPEQLEASVILIWSTPVDGDPYLSRVRLWPPGDLQETLTTSDQTELTPWKYNPASSRELILTHHRVPFPVVADLVAELQVALVDPNGELVPPGGTIATANDEGYVTINRIGLVPDSP